MKRFAVLPLMALIASCRLDTFFRGAGGGAPPVAGPPADLRFAQQPQTTHARKTLPPVRVAVRDDQGNVVAGFGGLVSLTLDSNPGGASLGDSTTVAAAHGIATFRHLRIDKAGTGYPLLAFAPGTAPAPAPGHRQPDRQDDDDRIEPARRVHADSGHRAIRYHRRE